jgi:hypothetical protein
MKLTFQFLPHATAFRSENKSLLTGETRSMENNNEVEFSVAK